MLCEYGQIMIFLHKYSSYLTTFVYIKHKNMAKFRVNILGSGSAVPSLRHLPSCQVIDFRDKLFMIDCGECAQLTMRRMRLKFSRLNHVFISHLHGDHCFGLIGLLSTLSLHEKGGTLTVHIFEEGARMFQQALDYFCRERSYDIKFNIIKPEAAVIYEDDGLEVSTIPLKHRVPCVGFIFKEKPKLRHLKGDMVKFYNVPIKQLHDIKCGADFVTDDGVVVPNERLTTDPDPVMSYAYCSDTQFDPRLGEALKGVKVIYHEATYDDSNVAKAAPRGHSTAREAAKIASMAGAEKLILGHYSKSYENEDQHLAQALEEFPVVTLATEGLKIDLL